MASSEPSVKADNDIGVLFTEVDLDGVITNPNATLSQHIESHYESSLWDDMSSIL